MREEADQERAEQAADQVHADHVERVVEAELVLQPDRERSRPTPASRPRKIAPTGVTEPRTG